MDKQRFDDLKESIIEAGKVMRGEMKPSREFTFAVDTSEIHKPIETWAICVETDDEELMIPGKVYAVKITRNRILVTDEEGEPAFYPKEFFMPISLPAEVSLKLGEVVKNGRNKIAA